MTVTLHQANLEAFKHSPSGPVHRAVASVVRKTEAFAKIGAPVDTGRLRNSGRSSIRDEPTRVVGRVEFTARYALVVHQGHGVIRPRRAKVLVWQGPDGLVFATRVRAVKGRPFLVDALKKASPWPVVVHS